MKEELPKFLQDFLTEQFKENGAIPDQLIFESFTPAVIDTNIGVIDRTEAF